MTNSPSAYDNYFVGPVPNFQPIEQYYGYTAPPFDKTMMQGEKNDLATEAMKQFNLYSFERAAPGVLFGRGDSGFRSAQDKTKGIGFRNVYNSLFGQPSPAIIDPDPVSRYNGTF